MKFPLKASGFIGVLILASAASAQVDYPDKTHAIPIPKIEDFPLLNTPFTGTVESLKQYKCPDWFRDGKFGIWAHWGPQAVPGDGDWYARNVYEEGSGVYKDHIKVYGPPSKSGYKDIIPLWKAEKWDPDRLMELYKAAGAHYFVAQAVHHDNFDNWNSKYHKWNSVNMGPQKDMVGIWQKAAQKQGLRFGVSEHLAASFTWFQHSHSADKNGPLAGVPYDGADPAYWDLYHLPAKPGDHGWYSNDPRWFQEWYARIYDLVDQYKPDLLYSDGALPFGDVGFKMVAQLYNVSAQQNNGQLQAVYNCKNNGTGPFYKGTCVEDVERGEMNNIQPLPWQTDTSTGDWFYNKNDHYKSSDEIIHTLTDIVSKNGNLLLNVVLYPDGSLPPEMETFLSDMADWMKINGDAIFGTRPWVIYGEGSSSAKGGAFSEGTHFTARDVRFTTKGSDIYALVMGLPTTSQVVIHSLGTTSPLVTGTLTGITLLGSPDTIQYSRAEQGLVIQLPVSMPCKSEICFKISGFSTVTNLSADTMDSFKASLRDSFFPSARPDGTIKLSASDAETHGSTVRVEGGEGTENVGWWNDPKDSVSWRFKVLKTGSYQLLVQMGAENESAFAIEVGSQNLSIKSPGTTGFNNYTVVDMGEIKIDQVGIATLTIKPNLDSWKPINIRSIQLKPVSQSN